MAFVYNKQYDTKGILWKPTIRLMVITLYIFQLMNIGYFSTVGGPKFLLAGVIFMVIQSGFLLSLSLYSFGKQTQDRFEISLLEQGLNPLEDP